MSSFIFYILYILVRQRHSFQFPFSREERSKSKCYLENCLWFRKLIPLSWIFKLKVLYFFLFQFTNSKTRQTEKLRLPTCDNFQFQRNGRSILRSLLPPFTPGFSRHVQKYLFDGRSIHYRSRDSVGQKSNECSRARGEFSIYGVRSRLEVGQRASARLGWGWKEGRCSYESITVSAVGYLSFVGHNHPTGIVFCLRFFPLLYN